MVKKPPGVQNVDMCRHRRARERKKGDDQGGQFPWSTTVKRLDPDSKTVGIPTPNSDLASHTETSK